MAAKEQPHGTHSKERCAVLVQEAHPGLYRKNAFRILSLPVDASPRQINRQVQRIRMLVSTGSDGSQQTADPLRLDRSLDGDAIHAAIQRLRDPESRMADELFWFWALPAENSEQDDTLLSALEDGDYDRTTGVFKEYERKHNGNPVSSHNLAVLAHALALDLEHRGLTGTLTEKQQRQREFCWRYAYAKWKTCLEQEGLWKRLRERVRELDDPRITTGLVRRFRATLPLALLSINARLCTLAAEKGNASEANWHLQLMGNAGFDLGFVDEAMRSASASIQQEIKLQCKSARKESEQNPDRAEEISRRLIAETKRSIDVLKTILQTGNTDREAVCDDVALTVLECQIGFVVKTDDLRPALELLQQADYIAETQSAHQRIQENIRIIKDNLECKPCWFCEEYLARGETDLQLKTNRGGIRARASRSSITQHQSRTVAVPRCVRCKSVHMQTRAFAEVGGVLGGLASIALCVGLRGEGADAVIQGLSILGIALGIGMGSHVGYVIARLLAPEGVKPESAKKEYPGVKTSTDEGWGTNREPAHVR